MDGLTMGDTFLYKNRLGITALSAHLETFSYKKHAHEEYALGVTLKGIQAYDLEGCSQASYTNGVMLFNPEQVHDGRAGTCEESLEYIMLYIKPELFLEALGEKNLLHFCAPIVYEERLKTAILNLVRAILTEKDEALCHELFLHVSDYFSTKNLLNSYKNENALITKTKEMIYDGLENVLHIETIAQELNLSIFKLIRLFKAGTGITPYQYFLNSKLSHAKKHLDAVNDLYATVVAFGFTDLSHFNRHFKRVYGLTAYEYLTHKDKR